MIPKRYIILLLAFLIILLPYCGKREWENPFDTEVEIQPPTGFTADPISDSQIRLNWQKSEDVKTCYIIERKKQDENNYQFLIELGYNISSYIDTALTIEKEYYYRLKGKSGDNVTDVKHSHNHTTFIDISNFSIQQENIFTAKLTWTHNCTYEEGYIIERRELPKESSNGTNITQSYSIVRKEKPTQPEKLEIKDIYLNTQRLKSTTNRDTQKKSKNHL
ncbi:MAG: hypothetical protein KAW92_07095 [Candidatus Cloacimonetes bacterium]|nr:hypothetical protein [Candidatus Cloacimonadota bacterium]